MSLGDKMKLTKRDKILYLVTLILIIGGDQFTKHLVSSSMLLGQSHEIINNFFYFTYAHNTGVAWGMFAGKLGLFIVVADDMIHSLWAQKSYIAVSIPLCMTIWCMNVSINQIRTLAFYGRVVYIYGKLRFLLRFRWAISTESKRDT